MRSVGSCLEPCLKQMPLETVIFTSVNPYKFLPIIMAAYSTVSSESAHTTSVFK